MTWQPLTISDVDHIGPLVEEVHTDLHERPEVFAEKVGLFPDGCRKVVRNGELVAFGISHPWNLYSIPSLDTFLSDLPARADCLYLHDIVVSPTARGHKLADQFVDYAKQLAHDLDISCLALVSVYGTSVFWSRFGFQEYTDTEFSSRIASYGPTAKYMVCDLAQN